MSTESQSETEASKEGTDCNESDPTLRPREAPPPRLMPSSKATKGKKKGSRQTSYTPTEDKLLCMAWAKETNDGARGNKKKKSDMWNDVQAQYRELVKVQETHLMQSATAGHGEDDEIFSFQKFADRSETSLQNRWEKHLHPAMMKFSGLVAHNPLGTGEDIDLYYKRLMMLYLDREGVDFNRFLECYKFLKDQPKFQKLFSDDEERDHSFEGEDGGDADNGSSAIMANSSTTKKRTRPQGQKKHKESEMMQKTIAGVATRMGLAPTTGAPNTGTAASNSLNVAVENFCKMQNDFSAQFAMAFAPSEIRDQCFSKMAEVKMLEMQVKQRKLEKEMNELTNDNNEMHKEPADDAGESADSRSNCSSPGDNRARNA